MESSPSDSIREELGPEDHHDRAVPPDVMTPACKLYFEDHFRLLGFMGFVSHIASERDRMAVIAASALLDGVQSDAEAARNRQVVAEGGVGALKTLRRYRQLLLQLVVSRGADQFLTYVSDLLAIVFRTRPETMRSNEQVSLNIVLQHQAMEELIAELAERKVQSLSYQGMRDLAVWLEERLGLRLLEDEIALARAMRIVEYRNLFVHNRGVVNDLFLKRVVGYRGAVGDVLQLDIDELLADLDFLAHCVADFDRGAVLKFRLPATVRPEDLRPLE